MAKMGRKGDTEQARKIESTKKVNLNENAAAFTFNEIVWVTV